MFKIRFGKFHWITITHGYYCLDSSSCDCRDKCKHSRGFKFHNWSVDVHRFFQYRLHIKLPHIGLLFISSLQTKVGACRICDKCGKKSPYAENFNEAIDKAKEAGWITKKVNDKWEDYCPDCQKEVL